MISQFPQFQLLTSTTYPHVESALRRFPPYSAFNPYGMWSWNTDGKLKICTLAGNMVFRFANFLDGTLFYSFIGDNEPDLTAATLIRRSMAERLEPALYLVPESVANCLDPAVFDRQEDPDHFDYILSVDALCAFEGHPFAAKRAKLRKFLRRFGQAVFKIVDFDDPKVVQDCKELFWNWWKAKHERTGLNYSREFEAFTRCIDARRKVDLFVAGVYVYGALRAFCVCQIGQNGFAFGHFVKADTEGFPYISVFLKHKVAQELATRGIKYLNIEQDLGIPGLRAEKMSYRPCHMLKKYVVRFSAMERTLAWGEMANAAA